MFRLAILIGLMLAPLPALAQSTVGTASTILRDGSGDVKPIPDPTLLTTQQLDRALAAQQAVIDANRTGDAKLLEEKFKGVAQQFEQNDRALIAALAAAKEAVGKTEITFAKQIENLDAKIAEAGKNTDNQINDLKLRLATIEGQSKGSDNTWAAIVAVLGVVALVAGVIIGALGLRARPERTISTA